MSLDIIIFAVVAAVLVARLKSVLGTRSGDDRARKNPFAEMDKQPPAASPAERTVITPDVAAMAPHTIGIDETVLKTDRPEEVREGLQDIAAADHRFEPGSFLQGARMAFQMITEAFAKGDKKALKPLLSDDLYAAFERVIDTRAGKGYSASYELHRIRDARIQDARLGGVMAYVTVDFDIEHTSLIRDADGNAVEGDPDKIAEVHDIWTFARDTRSPDPNWELVSTRIGDG